MLLARHPAPFSLAVTMVVMLPMFMLMLTLIIMFGTPVSEVTVAAAVAIVRRLRDSKRVRPHISCTVICL